MKYGTLEDFCKRSNGRCYIYGAGVWGYYVVKHILVNTDYGMTIDNILVSSKENNYNNILGIQVKEIGEIGDLADKYIIIAISPEYVSEVVELISSHGCKNIYAVSYAEYLKLRADMPEVFAEVRQDVRGLNQSIKARITNLNDNVNNKSANISRMNMQLLALVKKHGEIISEKIQRYKGRTGDEERYKEEFAQLIQKQDVLERKIHSLTHDMDEQSVYEIYRIIDRLHRLVEERPIVFSEEECEAIRRYEEHFTKNVFKLTNEDFCYRSYHLPKGRFEASVFWYKHGIEQIENLERIKESDFIDAGGYIGDSALILSEYTTGKVYSFEADKSNYELIKKTIERNGRNNIIPECAALVDCDSEIEFHLSNNAEINLTGTIVKDSLKANSMGTNIVKGISIDSYVRRNGLKIGLIKTDVEGAEMLLLKGAEETIRTQRPAMLISIYHSIADFFDIKTWIEELDLGYKFSIFRPVVTSSFVEETMLICEPADI